MSRNFQIIFTKFSWNLISYFHLQNGFKCHTSSEAHQRQLLLFAETPESFLDAYSGEFEKTFISLLSRCHGTKRTFANAVYQEYIKEKDHTHMNATKWTTLVSFQFAMNLWSYSLQNKEALLYRSRCAPCTFRGVKGKFCISWWLQFCKNGLTFSMAR